MIILGSLTESELIKWGNRLSASDWSWATWKYLLLDTGLILLWLAFFTVFILMLLPKTKKKLELASGYKFATGQWFYAFICTWTAGLFAHPAIFGSGPYGYWLHQLIGPSAFANCSDWTFRYMTLLGLISW
ncbi:hypothetical protein [Aliikangiella sp. IMCC44359]|uniref:hypothetical protein n=1 Tax=Aliikangiella sp. IMCC44359 TaxID=3459125 RepID=UPI00403ABB16